MALKGENWLALTPEETLEPDIPICDPHHHFWISRPEPAAYQRYLLPELAADVNSGHNVRSTVFIEVRCEYRRDGPEEMRPVGEVEYIETIADESAAGSHGPSRAAAAIIGHADLKIGDAARPVLEAMQQASPTRFRGIRHSTGWDASPELAQRDIQRRSVHRRLPGRRPGHGRHGPGAGKLACTTRNFRSLRPSPAPFQI